MRHDLKIWPVFFRLVRTNEMRVQVRYNDRLFNEEDELNLREFKPCQTCGGIGRIWSGIQSEDVTDCNCRGTPHERGTYTGAAVLRRVTRVVRGVPGIDDGHVLLLLGAAKKKR